MKIKEAVKEIRDFLRDNESADHPFSEKYVDGVIEEIIIRHVNASGSERNTSR